MVSIEAHDATFYLDILEYLPVPIAIVRLEDPDDLGSFRFLYANPANRLNGVERETFMGKTIRERFPQLLNGEIPTRYLRGLETGQPQRLPFIWFEENRHRRAYEVVFVPIDDRLGIVTGLDITNQKRAEALSDDLIQQLRLSNDELQRFAYVASHDMQEPLRTITSFLQLMEDDKNSRFSDTALEYLEYVTDAATRLRYLIGEILAFSRVKTRPLAVTSCDLEQLVLEVRLNLKQLIDETGAKIIVVGDLPTIQADAGHVRRLLQNVIDNAIKYHHPIRKPKVTLQVIDDGAYWRLDVTDNGQGIAPQYREQIFQVFKRLHSRVEIPGSGIGLAIAKRIMEVHGGHLGVESQLGEYSKFWFRFPKQVTEHDLSNPKT